MKLATTDQAKQAVAKSEDLKVQDMTLAKLLESPSIRARFEDMLHEKAAGFISSIISVANQNRALKTCDPRTVIAAAAIAASLDLPINPSLGFAWIVPYSGKAQFQMGWKGFVQLAQRTGLYRGIGCTEVYADEIESWDPVTEEFVATPMDGRKQRDAGDRSKIVGYLARFKLLNGYQKDSYWSVKDLDAHGKRFSKSFEKQDGAWKTYPEAMRMKTALKSLLSKWGPLSVDYITQKAIQADQAVVSQIPEAGKEADFEYVDSTTSESGQLFENEKQQTLVDGLL